MPTMPLQAISLLLHAFVGWRLVPALGSPAAGVLLAMVLIVSALTLPYGLGARRGGKGRRAQLLAWVGLVCMGLFSSLFVLSLARDALLLASVAIDALRPGTIAVGSLVVPSRVRRLSLLVMRSGASPMRAAARIVRIGYRSRGCRPGSTASRSHRWWRHVGPTIKRPYVRGDRRRGQPPRRHLVAITGGLVGGSVRSPPTSHRSPRCARRKGASSSLATTSTTLALRPGCASCAGSGSLS
jgi:hypothetical protein